MHTHTQHIVIIITNKFPHSFPTVRKQTGKMNELNSIELY